jgi:hypothetical protein
MPYVATCPGCQGEKFRRQWPAGVLVPCRVCGATGKHKHREGITLQNCRQHGWGHVLPWPRMGEAGQCQVCGQALTGKQSSFCGHRHCKELHWYRLYDGVNWAKRHVCVRDGASCRNCGEVFEGSLVPGGPVYPQPHALELDHIVPLEKGGGENPGNLQLLCARCHAAKSAAETTQRARLRKGMP